MLLWLGIAEGVGLAYIGEENTKKESNYCLRLTKTGL